MARDTRRNVFRTVGVSVMATALALPAGVFSAVAAPHLGNEIPAGISAQTTSPPPTPTPTPTPTEDSPPPESTPSDESTPPSTPPSENETEDQDGTPENEQSTGPREEQPDQTVSESAAEQKQEIESITEELSQKMTEVPKTLKPAVARLTATLQAAQGPGTPPQEKDGIIDSAKEVAAVLDVISAPGSPADAREQLIGIVKQVTSALEVVSDPRVRPEERAMTILTVQRSTSVLKMIGDPATPQELQDDLSSSVDHLNRFVLRRSQEEGTSKGTSESSPSQQSLQSEGTIAVALDTISDSETSDEDSKGLAGTTNGSSSSLDGSSDPRVSKDDQEKEKKKLAEKIARLEKQVEEVASARGLPDVPLGEAAEVCTNAVFTSVTEPKLIGGLRDLAPAKWEGEGVKDYWKSKKSGQDSLDVQAQLRNDTLDHAAFDIARLIPQLAESAPAGELFGTIGTPALHCLRSALHLHQEGVEAGTWLKMAEEKA
jgi:hypothetical protein